MRPLHPFWRQLAMKARDVAVCGMLLGAYLGALADRQNADAEVAQRDKHLFTYVAQAHAAGRSGDHVQ